MVTEATRNAEDLIAYRLAALRFANAFRMLYNLPVRDRLPRITPRDDFDDPICASMPGLRLTPLTWKFDHMRYACPLSPSVAAFLIAFHEGRYPDLGEGGP